MAKGEQLCIHIKNDPIFMYIHCWQRPKSKQILSTRFCLSSPHRPQLTATRSKGQHHKRVFYWHPIHTTIFTNATQTQREQRLYHHFREWGEYLHSEDAANVKVTSGRKFFFLNLRIYNSKTKTNNYIFCSGNMQLECKGTGTLYFREIITNMIPLSQSIIINL